MAVYAKDNPALFRQAVISVLGNTLQPQQFVLVVDGPVPAELEQVIQGVFERKGGEVSRLPENRGLAHALNTGLERVRTAWTVRADADDINLPERFATLARAARREASATVLGSAILEVDRAGTPLSIRRPPLSHEEIMRQLPLRNPFNHMAVAYHTRTVLEQGGYPPVHLKEDYALWCRLARAGARFANLPQVLVHATTGADMIRRRGGWKYIRSEIEMQRLMVQQGLKGPLAAGLHGLARSSVFALPGWARSLVYRRFLRTRAPGP